MQNRIDRIKKERKLKGLRWSDLAEGLPVSGEAIRVAFFRNSVDEVYLNKIEETLGIKERTKSTEVENNDADRFEDIVAKKVLQQFRPVIEKILESHQESKTALQTALISIAELLEEIDDLKEKVNLLTEIDKEVLNKVSGK